MNINNDDVNRKIKDIWQPFYDEELTLKDTDEIRTNLLRFAKCIKQLVEEKKF